MIRLKVSSYYTCSSLLNSIPFVTLYFGIKCLYRHVEYKMQHFAILRELMIFRNLLIYYQKSTAHYFAKTKFVTVKSPCMFKSQVQEHEEPLL